MNIEEILRREHIATLESVLDVIDGKKNDWLTRKDIIDIIKGAIDLAKEK